MQLVRVPQTLRPYQEDATTAVITALAEKQRPICSLATGLGKTTLIAEVLRRLVDPYTQRALVIAHTHEIVGQIYDRIADQFSGALDRYYGYMKPGIGLVAGDTNVPMARVVVATRQSLHKKRLAEILSHGAFSTIVIDEAHHALGEMSSYSKIIDDCLAANPDLKLFGTTATPARADKQALASLWDVICYEMDIQAGIEQGYLSPITRLRIKTKVDLHNIGSSEGDYRQKQLVSALEAENWLDLCIEAYETYIAATARPTLAFMPSVEMSRQFAQAMNDAGHKAGHVDGETPKDERAALLKAFAAGKLKVLTNFGVMTEGVDLPRVGAILMGRPTRSRILLTQMIGRGTRQFPGKTDCLLVDMTVFDTKVIQAGTLLGKMKLCPTCDAEVWDFYKVCPHCGYAWPPPKPKPEQEEPLEIEDGVSEWRGAGLEAEQSGLFENTVAAWYLSPTGSMSCALALNMGSLFIIPPSDDGYYKLYRVPQHGDVSFVARNQDAASLIRSGDMAVEAMGAVAIKNMQEWRNQKASTAQRNLLKKFGVDAPEGIGKGPAAEIIGHYIARQKLYYALKTKEPAAPTESQPIH